MSKATVSYSQALIKHLEGMLQKQKTLPAEGVPLVFHEPGILTGYRIPNQPWMFYIKSAFQIHNETLNIWTHVVGSLIVLQQMYTYFCLYDSAESKLSVSVLAAGFSFFLTTMISSVTHLLCSKSAFHQFAFFMADYLSAAFSVYGSGLLAMYGYSDPDFYASVGDWYLCCQAVSMYFVFVTVCLSKLWYGQNPHDMRRKYMLLIAYIVHGMLNLAPVSLRYIKCFNNPDCSMSSLNHINTVLIISCLQGASYASHQPERTWPGKFDIIGHSHQLFHVVTTINHVLQFSSLHLDFTNGLTDHCQPDFHRVFMATGVLTFAGLVTLFYFVKLVPKALVEQQKRS